MKLRNLILKSTLLILILGISFGFSSISAQNRPSSDGNFEVDNKVGVGVEEIRIPIFTSVIGFNTSTASVFTWVAFVGSLATIGLVIFWVYLLIRAGIQGIQSQGSEEGLQEAYKKVRGVLVGAGISLAFPLVLSVVGVFFGIGSIFNWPRAFQLCDKNTDTYDWYFQALFDKDANPASSPDVADGLCITDTN